MNKDNPSELENNSKTCLGICSKHKMPSEDLASVDHNCGRKIIAVRRREVTGAQGARHHQRMET